MRTLHKLTDVEIRALKPNAIAPKKRLISDGGGLYLSMTKSGTKSWVFRYRHDGRQKDVGLGGYPTVSLKLARETAQTCRTAQLNGDDVLHALRPPKPDLVTFKEAFEQFMIDKRAEKPSPIVLQEWIHLQESVSRPLHSKDIATITSSDLIKVLRPKWTTTPVSAKKAQQRLERFFRWSKANKLRTGPNPAAWRENLEDALPKQKHTVKHHAAMPYGDVPDFMAWLITQSRPCGAALQLLVLTGCRTSEILKAPIEEFDLQQRLWTIDASRMKNRQPHTVPLSDQAYRIVRMAARGRQSGLLFESGKPGKPFSLNTLPKCLRDFGLTSEQATVHGFRSSFRDWAGDATITPREVAEAALSHQIGSSVERTYRRGTAIEKRKVLMQEWANYCFGNKNAVEQVPVTKSL
jgi:integrase